MPHYLQFYKDFQENESRLTIKRAVINLKKPQLTIHGSEDPTVSIKEALAMKQWNPMSQLEIINGADHVFGSVHPWQKPYIAEDLQKAVDLTLAFLK
jgi:pimeloyl-ACP methyl ester carboxylesterase